MTHTPDLNIVVEGLMDAQLIRAMLGRELVGKLRFFAAGGRISLATVGRNILVHEGGPVLLVMDSDTRNQQLADEQQAMALMAVSGVAPRRRLESEWVRVYAFVPEIEIVFFEAPQVFKAILAKKLSDERLQEGLLAPKPTLLKILDESKLSHDVVVKTMSPHAASLLASGRQAQGLIATIESMLSAAVEA